MMQEIKEGIGWLLRHPTMRVLAVTVGMVNLTYTASSAVFVLYVRRELHLGSLAYGSLLAATAVGAMLGGLLVARATRSLGPGRVLSVALALATASRIGLGLTHEVFAAAGCLLLGGMGITVFAVVSISFRQRLVPDRQDSDQVLPRQLRVRPAASAVTGMVHRVVRRLRLGWSYRFPGHE